MENFIFSREKIRKYEIKWIERKIMAKKKKKFKMKSTENYVIYHFLYKFWMLQKISD